MRKVAVLAVAALLAGGLVAQPAVASRAASTNGYPRVDTLSVNKITDTTATMTWSGTAYPSLSVNLYRIRWEEKQAPSRTWASTYAHTASPLRLIGLLPGREYLLTVSVLRASDGEPGNSMTARFETTTPSSPTRPQTTTQPPTTPRPSPTTVASRYQNCPAVWKVYPHGVGRKGAVDKVGIGVKPVRTFRVDNRVYAANAKRLDRDRDGIVCERR